MANETISNVRPRQVLLVGLGGVGSRTVDNILSIMPDSYRRYTKAIAVDTDLEELDKLLKYIPTENRIALGSNPDNGQSVTVGEYIRNNPETTEWFVKGEHLDLIKRRNTAQGAKQIRMVSRIALAATNDFCGMKKKLEDILQDLNKADGTTLSRGLLVMVVCSVAGGTGAGTVLSFPLYLEQALSKTFSDEDVQMECAMLLPNIFSRAQDIENQEAARANAYAVVRELMSLNSGRLKRGDILPDCNFEDKADNASPYGRVLFFDDVSMSGDSLDPDLDRVHVPKTAKALNEYLFGPVSGKITSALDNTLARVYRTGGASIFSSVGTARLEFPRATYVQYVLSQWITKVISENWTDVDIKANKMYKDALKQAINRGTKKPEASDRRKYYCDCLDEAHGAFYREIKAPYVSVINKKKVDAANEFWQKCRTYLHGKITNNSSVISAVKTLEGEDTKITESKANIVQYLQDLEKAAMKSVENGTRYAFDVMRPVEAADQRFYADNNDDVTYLYVFLKKKKLHPIMLRYFLYRLYEIVDNETKKVIGTKIDYENVTEPARRKTDINDREGSVNTLMSEIMTKAKNEIVFNFAQYLKNELERYIEEIDGMFKSLEEIIRVFGERKNRCINNLEASNSKTGTVLAGGELSMKYVWKKVEERISDGEDAYAIDDDLNIKIHELVYKAYMAQTTGGDDQNQSAASLGIKVKTKYNVIMAKELQIYYSRLLKENYYMCFPQSVVEAALLECGLRNRYSDEKSRVDSTQKFGYDEFITRGSKPLNYATDVDDIPDGMISDARYLRALLDNTLNNSKPYCGRVDDNASYKGIINRLMAVSTALRRETEDPYNVDEFGVAGKMYIEDELIDGVSTSEVGGKGVNTKFVGDGISVDEIKFITTLAGLQPFNFVAFLPPDDDEHAPTKGKTYYGAYRNIVDDIAVRNDCITPHLHRDWHLADALEDITEDHTNAYNKNAAEAFVYGFVFDVIRVVDDGVVEIGKSRDPYFEAVLGGNGIKEFSLLDPTIHANMGVDEDVKLTPEMIEQRRNTLNSILVKIFELLATSKPLREAIIGYSETLMKENAIETKPEFLENCTKSEDISGIQEIPYECILDVIDGYYQGTRHLPYKESDRGRLNTSYMFEFIMKKIYETSKMFSADASGIKDFYENSVEILYDSTDYCDELVDKILDDEVTAEDDGSAAKEVKDKNDTELSPIERIRALSAQATKKKPTSGSKPFAFGGQFAKEVALDMIDVFLKKYN